MTAAKLTPLSEIQGYALDPAFARVKGLLAELHAHDGDPAIRVISNGLSAAVNTFADSQYRILEECRAEIDRLSAELSRR